MKKLIFYILCYFVSFSSIAQNIKKTLQENEKKNADYSVSSKVNPVYKYSVIRTFKGYVEVGNDTIDVGNVDVLIDSINSPADSSVYLALVESTLMPKFKIDTNRVIYVRINEKYKDIRKLQLIDIYMIKQKRKFNDNKYKGYSYEIGYLNQYLLKKEAYQRNSLFASINYLYGYSYRNLQVNASGAGKAFNERYQAESPLLQGNAVFKMGYIIQYNHYLFANFAMQKFGYKLSEPKGYDWKQGVYNDENPRINQLSFNTYGVGIGYRYALYRTFTHVQPFIEGSLNYNRIDTKSINVPLDIFHEQSFPLRSISATIQGGISIALYRAMAISLAPYYTTNLHGFKGKKLTTRFYNYGLNIAFDIRFGTLQNRTKLRNNMRE